jgi:quercetin dioxygenase-like cupin family protein
MSVRLGGLLPSTLGVLLMVLSQGSAAAQYVQPSLANRYESGWENDQLRVRRISIEPGAQAPVQHDADSVFVFLTADLQGRMPPAEAIWQPAGAQELENRGRLRVDAVLIELKNGPVSAPGITPPEVLPTADAVDVRLLIDNPRVIVAKQRYFAGAYAVGPRHFHPQDALIVYLRGGFTLLPYSAQGPYRVRRGDIDVLPANTFHRFGNAGGDPLEFLVIFPK